MKRSTFDKTKAFDNITPTSALQNQLRSSIQSQNNSNPSFDVIVLGVGSMGAAACYHLAKAGVKVLGIEQFDIPNTNSSHTGQSRLIRKAYSEHPNYVPLLRRAYSNWSALEQESGIQHYYKTGLLYFGLEAEALISGLRLSAQTYDIEVSELQEEAHKSLYPQFNLPSSFAKLLEPDAGFLIPERAILTYANLASSYGAIFRTHEKVISWTSTKDGIEVTTNKGRYTGNKVVVTTGPWTAELLPTLKDFLKVTKQALMWVKPKEGSLFDISNFPCWSVQEPNASGFYYGFPIFPVEQIGGPIGLKVAYHDPAEIVDPNRVDKKVSKEEQQQLIAFLHQYLPDAYEQMYTTQTCLYTNTPDHHFILDMHPQHEKVIIGAGFSGHGFKFVSVVGEILADLTIHGKTDLPIEFLSAKRG